jgi:hypothetical protein
MAWCLVKQRDNFNFTFFYLISVKVTLSLCFNWTPCHEDVLENGGIAPRLLDLGTRWRWVVSFTPPPHYPQEKSPWYPLERRVRGPHSLSGRGGEEKNTQLLPRLDRSPALYHWAILAPILTSVASIFYVMWLVSLWDRPFSQTIA